MSSSSIVISTCRYTGFAARNSLAAALPASSGLRPCRMTLIRGTDVLLRNPASHRPLRSQMKVQDMSRLYHALEFELHRSEANT